MKRIRAWLLPLVTCLSVLTVTILPRYLSDIQDQKIIGHIHTEKLPVENSLPTQPPDLPQRILLLSQWVEDSDVMSVQNDITESDAENSLNTESITYSELCSAALAELKAFADSELLPLDLSALETSHMNISRVYLQKQLIGIQFYVFETYVKAENVHFWVVLDSESMHMVWLELGHPAMEKYYQSLSPEEMGTFFLNRLGMTCDLIQAGKFDAVFQITDMDLRYGVSVEPYFLKIFPIIADPTMDASPSSGK